MRAIRVLPELLILVLLAGCAGDARTPDATMIAPATGTAPALVESAGPGSPETAPPAQTEEPSEPTATAAEAARRIETEWGRIWDRLPAGFPIHPDALPLEDAGDESRSAAYTIETGAVEEIVTWMQAALEDATYSTEALSGPLDDGGYVIDSVGDAGCRIEVAIAPAEPAARVTVRYGAECPIDN